MSYSDPTLRPDGFEGIIIQDANELAVKLPLGFQGIVISNRANAFPKFPIGFEGILIEYATNRKFIQVVTSRGTPLQGCEVVVTQGVSFTEITNEFGIISGVFDVSGTLPVRIKSGKTYYDFTINAASQPIVTTFVFPLDFTD